MTITHKLAGNYRPACGADSWDNTVRPERVTCTECQEGAGA